MTRGAGDHEILQHPYTSKRQQVPSMSLDSRTRDQKYEPENSERKQRHSRLQPFHRPPTSQVFQIQATIRAENDNYMLGAVPEGFPNIFLLLPRMPLLLAPLRERPRRIRE